jgi:glutamate-ammonia-ligase adenylyltransferase
LRITSLSNNFISEVADKTAGYFSAGELDRFINAIEAELPGYFFTFASESNLLRIISGMYDRVNFIYDCIKYPHYLEAVLLISVNSNYLTDIIVRSPEYFYWVVNPDHLLKNKSRAEFTEEISSAVAPYKSFDARVNSLRRYKRKELLRIGLKDLGGHGSLLQITEELSFLAKAITEELFSLSYREMLQKYNISRISNQYCLAALGKLGGDELNYSSDIDLILFFDKNTTVKKKEYFEILTEAAYLFIDNATRLTDTGFLYRVDFRLRPDGRTSLLCRTMQDYLAYYESRGEDWERQMLIKASFCAGSEELFNSFYNYLQPFIYPVSFSVSPTEQIRRLKQNTEKNLKSDEDIKLSAGGIRDIEFSVQALQLLNAGRVVELRTGNTLKGIDKLKKNEILSENEASVFVNAYTVYRRVEHFLQLMNDKQTHTVPQEGELAEKLSFYLGYKNLEYFQKEIKIMRRQVREIFESIVGTETEAKIEEINYSNRKKAEADLKYLKTGAGLLGEKLFDNKTSSAFEEIEPEILSFLKQSENPDLVLSNFVRVIRNEKFPSQWYAAFKENSQGTDAYKFLHDFLYLCGNSQKAIDLFSEDADLRDYFISKSVFQKISSAAFRDADIKKVIFTLAVQYPLGMINEEKVSKELSGFVQQVIIHSAGEMLKGENIPYAICTLGSAATGDMNFSSDVDLIFIAEDSGSLLDKQRIFQDLLLEIKQKLKPIDIDCRLRPEGKSSYLLWDIGSYKEYIQKRARVWELQSFTKMIFSAGQKKLFTSLKKEILKKIEQTPVELLTREISDMKKKYSSQWGFSEIIDLKKSTGSFSDIEFLIQYFLLSRHELFRANQGKSMMKMLQAVIEFTGYNELSKMEETYLFLKKVLMDNQCRVNSTGYKIKPANNFKERLSETLRMNNFLFKKYLGK